MIKVLDASAIILFFEAKPGCEKIKALFIQASQEKITLLTTSVNWGEARYILIRKYGHDKAKKVFQVFETLPIQVVDVTKDLALCASDLKAQYRIGYLDAMIAALAKTHKAECITTDKDLALVKDEIKIDLIS
jgi:predicted nucleic acid-binding protein